MIPLVIGSISDVDPMSCFSLQPVLHNWCNKCRGMCYLVGRMVHIKESLTAKRVAYVVALYHMSDAI